MAKGLNADLNGLRGLVIGRFQRASQVQPEDIVAMIRMRPALRGLPVIAQVDFGHTTPHLTLPLGGRARLEVEDERALFTILTH
jgi:muramoyltetrapeptide carboxypeptidase